MTTPWIAAILACWLALVLFAFVFVGVLRRVAAVLEALERRIVVDGRTPETLGILQGQTVDAFELFTREGRRVDSSLILDGTATLMLFFESSCPGCRTLAQELSEFGVSVQGVDLIVIMDDTREGHAFPLPDTLRVLYDRSRNASNAFHNRATPQAYVVGSDNLILERRLVGSARDLRALATDGLGCQQHNVRKAGLGRAVKGSV